MTPLASARLLAVISVLLALACVILAWRYDEARRAAICWRAVAEEGLAAEGECGGPR
jgi:hypothetical protein